MKETVWIRLEPIIRSLGAISGD
jgi:hypothetical protein